MESYKIDCCFTNDGAFVLSGSEDGKIFAWDLVQARFESFHAHGKPVRALASHPETPMLVSGCIDGSAKVWTNTS